MTLEKVLISINKIGASLKIKSNLVAPISVGKKMMKIKKMVRIPLEFFQPLVE